MLHAIDLAQDEKIIMEVRRHMFLFYARTIFVPIVLFIPLPFAVPIAEFLNTSVNGHGLVAFFFLYVVLFLIVWIAVFFQWTDYYLDTWVITNRRVFDIDQQGMFTREVSSFRIENIQDITVEINGLIATFLDYGNIQIHTAGESRNFIIRDAAHPLAIKDLILHQQPHLHTPQTQTAHTKTKSPSHPESGSVA